MSGQLDHRLPAALVSLPTFRRVPLDTGLADLELLAERVHSSHALLQVAAGPDIAEEDYTIMLCLIRTRSNRGMTPTKVRNNRGFLPLSRNKENCSQHGTNASPGDLVLFVRSGQLVSKILISQTERVNLHDLSGSFDCPKLNLFLRCCCDKACTIPADKVAKQETE